MTDQSVYLIGCCASNFAGSAFTLPATLHALALQNPRPLYTLRFQTVADTLLTIARAPVHLGADIGLLAILHTWGQQLSYHPHIHCGVPDGVLAPDGTRWVACQQPCLLPVRVLRRWLLHRFLEGLGKASTRTTLTYAGRYQLAKILNQVTGLGHMHASQPAFSFA